jgi:hypothetical protein
VGKKITELPSAAVLTGAELGVVVQDGATKQVAMQVVIDTVLAQAPAGLEGPPGPQGEPGPAGVAGWGDLGVYIGVAEPAGLKTYAEWLATKAGYWSWVDISGEPASAGAATLASTLVATSVRALTGAGTPLAALLNATATTSTIALTGAATGSLGGASIVSVSMSATVSALTGVAIGGATLVGVTATSSVAALPGVSNAGGALASVSVSTNVIEMDEAAPTTFVGTPSVGWITDNSVELSYEVVDEQGDHFALDHDATGSWVELSADVAPGAHTATITGLTANTGYGIRLRARPLTGTTTAVISQSASVATARSAVRFNSDTIGQPPAGWTRLYGPGGVCTVVEGSGLGKTNKLCKADYSGVIANGEQIEKAVSSLQYGYIASSFYVGSDTDIVVLRASMSGGGHKIQLAVSGSGGHVQYWNGSGYSNLPTDTSVGVGWHRVKAALNWGTNQATIYIDGVLKGTIPLVTNGEGINRVEIDCPGVSGSAPAAVSYIEEIILG